MYIHGRLGRHWSCPLCRNRERILTFWPQVSKWAQTCEIHCPRWDSNPMISRFWVLCSTVVDDTYECLFGLVTVCKMRPYGFTANENVSLLANTTIAYQPAFTSKLPPVIVRPCTVQKPTNKWLLSLCSPASTLTRSLKLSSNFTFQVSLVWLLIIVRPCTKEGDASPCK